MRILTDEVELENPIYFENLTNVIVKIIEESNPKFSIGVFGDWGTGKTTLMKLIENRFTDKNKLIERDRIPPILPI